MHALDLLRPACDGATTADSFCARSLLPAGLLARRRRDCLERTGAQFGELRLERLEATVRRIEAFERGAGIGGLGDLAQDIGRRRRVIAVVDFRQHPARRDAAGRQMAGISERRIGERDVGVGERLGAGGGAEVRDLIIGRVEPVGGGVRQLRDHRFGARVELAVGDPQRGIIARGIEGCHRLALGRAVDALVELPGRDDGAQLVGDLRVDRGRSAAYRRVPLMPAPPVRGGRCGRRRRWRQWRPFRADRARGGGVDRRR